LTYTHQTEHHVMTYNVLLWDFLQTITCYSESSNIYRDQTDPHC